MRKSTHFEEKKKEGDQKNSRGIYIVSSLFLAFIPFNGLKRLMGRFPSLYTLLSNTIRTVLGVLLFFANILIGITDVITFRGWGAQ